MGVMLRWCRLYAEWASDPKIQRLSEAMQRRHIMLLCLQCTGDLEKSSDNDLAYFLRIGIDKWLDTKTELEKKRLIHVNGNGTINIPAWEKRQPRRDHSTKRVQAWRKRHTCPECKMQATSVIVNEHGVLEECPFCTE